MYGGRNTQVTPIFILVMAARSNSRSLRCPFSGCIFETTSMPSVLSHLRLVHANDPNFSVPCGIEGCCKTSNTFSALYQHIYKKHKNSGVIQARKDTCITSRGRECSSTLNDHSADNFIDLETAATDHEGRYVI